MLAYYMIDNPSDYYLLCPVGQPVDSFIDKRKYLCLPAFLNYI